MLGWWWFNGNYTNDIRKTINCAKCPKQNHKLHVIVNMKLMYWIMLLHWYNNMHQYLEMHWTNFGDNNISKLTKLWYRKYWLNKYFYFILFDSFPYNILFFWNSTKDISDIWSRYIDNLYRQNLIAFQYCWAYASL